MLKNADLQYCRLILYCCFFLYVDFFCLIVCFSICLFSSFVNCYASMDSLTQKNSLVRAYASTCSPLDCQRPTEYCIISLLQRCKRNRNRHRGFIRSLLEFMSLRLLFFALLSNTNQILFYLHFRFAKETETTIEGLFSHFSDSFLILISQSWQSFKTLT